MGREGQREGKKRQPLVVTVVATRAGGCREGREQPLCVTAVTNAAGGGGGQTLSGRRGTGQLEGEGWGDQGNGAAGEGEKGKEAAAMRANNNTQSQ